MSPLELKLKDCLMTRRVSVARDGIGKASLYLFDDGTTVVVGVTRSRRPICNQHETLEDGINDFVFGVESLGFTPRIFEGLDDENR